MVVTGGHLEKPADVLLWHRKDSFRLRYFLRGELNRARRMAPAAPLPPRWPVP